MIIAHYNDRNTNFPSKSFVLCYHQKKHSSLTQEVTLLKKTLTLTSFINETQGVQELDFISLIVSDKN